MNTKSAFRKPRHVGEKRTSSSHQSAFSTAASGEKTERKQSTTRLFGRRSNKAGQLSNRPLTPNAQARKPRPLEQSSTAHLSGENAQTSNLSNDHAAQRTQRKQSTTRLFGRRANKAGQISNRPLAVNTREQAPRRFNENTSAHNGENAQDKIASSRFQSGERTERKQNTRPLGKRPRNAARPAAKEPWHSKKTAPREQSAPFAEHQRVGNVAFAQNKSSHLKIDWREPLNARQAAAQTLFAVVFKQQSLNGLLEETKAQVREPDQALYQALVYGCLREYPALSKLRDSFLQEPPSLEQAYLGIILNLGIYQLLRLSLGDHGVLNETVDLAKYFGIGNATGLINAILRRVQREREACRHLLEKYRIYNLPAWIATAQRQAIANLAEINRQQPPLTLRIRDNRDTWLAQHAETASANPLHPQAVTLHSACNVQDIAGFVEGQVSVQDASAQLAATLLAPQNGERILDACAAPGGKTGHLLELAPQAQVVALDMIAKRLEKVQDNLQRLGLRAQTLVADAAELNQWWNGEGFDGILLDAPCSGSGVLRRHPDIAFVRSADELKQLPKNQMRLLRALWQTLKPNGRLLYTTCSILPRENQQLIEHFLLEQPQAKLQTLDLPHCQDTGFGYLHLPNIHGDGFFYALLRKETA